MNINLDFETYSEADIRRVGAWAYSVHPSTEVIMLGYSIDGGPTELWYPEHGLDPLIKLRDQATSFSAFNAFFELSIWINVLGLDHAGVQWHDTAAKAAALSLPRSLDGCAKALKLDDGFLKDPRGKRLIQLLCKPGRDGARNREASLLFELGEYCRQDVVAERAVDAEIFDLNTHEKKVYALDQKINLRGVAVDVDLADKMLRLIDDRTGVLLSEIERITKGKLKNVNSHTQVQSYLMETFGVDLENFQKETISAMLDSGADLPPVARRVLEIRQVTGKTSTAKIKKLLMIADSENRARGLLRYHGASTGRWSGNLFQPQNLPRPSIGDTDAAADLIKSGAPLPVVDFYYGEPMEVISSTIRSLITVGNEKTHDLVCSDYSSIEPRVLAWLCGNDKLLDVFRSGKDPYKQEATNIYRLPYEQIDGEQRFVGKIALLSLGYGGGGRAFMGMAKAYGVDISFDRAEDIKHAYRDSNPSVVEFWHACETAAIKSIRSPGKTFSVGRVAFRCFNGFMFCRLPSGRALAYFQPSLGVGMFDKPEVQFYGTDSYTRKFCKQSTYGGKLVENITQAVARDVMADAMIKLEDAGCPVVLTVHDEVICEVPKSRGISVAEFEGIMTQTNPWADGIPVEADGGYISKRYRK